MINCALGCLISGGMMKGLTQQQMIYYQDERIIIRKMSDTDPTVFTEGEITQGWHAATEKLETRLREMTDGKCIVITAEYDGEPAGYVSVYKRAKSGAFAAKAHPEIVDFNVLEKFRNKGIGTKLMDVAEEIAAKYSDTVCLGVGLMGSYGSAQRMYVKRGYIPDGSGIWYKDKQCEPYAEYINDDDLVIYLSKKIVRDKCVMENRIEILRNVIDGLVDCKGQKEWFFMSRHMYAVSGYAAMLATKRGLDNEVATMIGLLHDIHTIITGNPDKHAKHGSVMAREILSELGVVTNGEIEIICNAIRHHGKKAETHDEYSELIKDADVLDHHFFNTILPVIEKDKERLGKLFAELGINNTGNNERYCR